MPLSEIFGWPKCLLRFSHTVLQKNRKRSHFTDVKVYFFKKNVCSSKIGMHFITDNIY